MNLDIGGLAFLIPAVVVIVLSWIIGQGAGHQPQGKDNKTPQGLQLHSRRRHTHRLRQTKADRTDILAI